MCDLEYAANRNGLRALTQSRCSWSPIFRPMSLRTEPKDLSLSTIVTRGVRHDFFSNLRISGCTSTLSLDLEPERRERIRSDRPRPWPMLRAANCDCDLVEMLFVAANRSTTTNAVGEFPTELLSPLVNALITDAYTAGRAHFLDHSQARREPEIERDHVAAYFRWKSAAMI